MLKTSEDWSRELAPDVHIFEKTGWDDSEMGARFAWYHEKIDREEFEDRFAQSVVHIPRGLHFIWKDAELNGRHL